MGICQGRGPKESVIDKDIKEDRRKGQRVKLLLLGAGESGKSTIAKQVKLIHLTGFSDDERRSYKVVVHQNLISSMQTLLEGAENLKLTTRFKPEDREYIDTVMACTDFRLTETLHKALTHLWTSLPVIETWEHAAQLQVIESAAYYLDALDRIAAPDYEPTNDDILRSRIKTTGILEIEFQIDGNDFTLVDVGGQRSERRKWLHCFQDVTAIIFCVSMSEYDQFLHEDDAVRRTDESTTLFEEICNSRWFAKLPVILFLTKYDLFKLKMKKVDLKVAFPEYDGGLDYKKGRDFLRNKYRSLNHQEKQIYDHVTNATNTSNVREVFADVVNIILRTSLSSATLL